MSERIKAKLDKKIVKFQYLCTIPTLEITPSLAEEECGICKEGYQNNEWQRGEIVHRPVALPCGHILGFQCLARWMLSPTFDNQCYLCRAQIIDPPATRANLNRELASSFARLEILAVVAGNGISRDQKSQLLDVFENSLWGEKALWVLTKNSDRVMVVWEEFLESVCTKSAITSEEERVIQLVEQLVAMPEDHRNLLFFALQTRVSHWLRMPDVQAGLFVLTAPVSAVTTFLWNRGAGGEYSITGMILDWKASTGMYRRAWLSAIFVDMIFAFYRIRLGYKTFLGALVLGLVLSSLGPTFEFLLNGWYYGK